MQPWPNPPAPPLHPSARNRGRRTATAAGGSSPAHRRSSRRNSAPPGAAPCRIVTMPSFRACRSRWMRRRIASPESRPSNSPIDSGSASMMRAILSLRGVSVFRLARSMRRFAPRRQRWASRFSVLRIGRAHKFRRVCRLAFDGALSTRSDDDVVQVDLADIEDVEAFDHEGGGPMSAARSSPIDSIMTGWLPRRQVGTHERTAHRRRESRTVGTRRGTQTPQGSSRIGRTPSTLT